MEECCLLAYFAWFSLSPFLHNPGPPAQGWPHPSSWALMKPYLMEAIPQLKFPFSRDSSLCQVDKCRLFLPAATPAYSNTCLQPQALAFVAVELYMSFPDFCLANSCMPFKTSLPWNASPVLVPVIAATTFLGTPPAQQLPPCANSLFAFCLSHQTLSSLKAVATNYSFLSPGLGSTKDKRCSHKWP